MGQNCFSQHLDTEVRIQSFMKLMIVFCPWKQSSDVTLWIPWYIADITSRKSRPITKFLNYIHYAGYQINAPQDAVGVSSITDSHAESACG